MLTLPAETKAFQGCQTALFPLEFSVLIASVCKKTNEALNPKNDLRASAAVRYETGNFHLDNSAGCTPRWGRAESVLPKALPVPVAGRD